MATRPFFVINFTEGENPLKDRNRINPARHIIYGYDQYAFLGLHTTIMAYRLVLESISEDSEEEASPSHNSTQDFAAKLAVWFHWDVVFLCGVREGCDCLPFKVLDNVELAARLSARNLQPAVPSASLVPANDVLLMGLEFG
ncbi:hypothetical protein RRG08_040073 [Elysia crispata]|uniref:Uncharacterized protein n=1 Tax=Elysia crispata TaxID=231223 RepID=A0AAE0XW52_9GAST|nr:hypothetical protein RRG08_040073 [Elysia crispata]